MRRIILTCLVPLLCLATLQVRAMEPEPPNPIATLEAHYGWGIARDIPNRTVVTIDALYGEVYAKMKGSVLGQRIYFGTRFVSTPSLKLMGGTAIWHQNNTGKIDTFSPWLRISVGTPNILEASVDWAIDTTQFRVTHEMPVQRFLPEIKSRVDLIATWDLGPYYVGPMVGLRTYW